MGNNYKNFVLYITELFKEEALEDRKDYENAYRKVAEHIDEKLCFQKGQLFIWARVLNLIKQQSEFFDIDLKELGLENFDPENELSKPIK